MKIKFKNTYEVSVMYVGGGDYEFYLADYDTFEEFANELKSHRVKWNKMDGEFSKGLNIVISEKDYGAVADWCHPELATYMQDNLYKDWMEDDDSVFFAPDLELEDVFNQLKQIDGVELELEVEVEPGDYINKYEGPYHYGKAWDKIKKIIEKPVKQSTSKPMKSLASYIDDKNDDDFVDWNTVCDDAIKNGYFKSHRR